MEGKTQAEIAGDAAQELVLKVLGMIVTRPEELEVEVAAAKGTAIVTVYTAPEDVGLVIGKQGRNVMALQTMLNCLGSKHTTKILCSIDNPRQRDDDAD